jgi:chorismate-pyruvate lyase
MPNNPKPHNNLQTYYSKTDAQIDRRYQSEGFIGGGAVQFVDGGSIAMDALPPILRTLLVTDGTVTKLLEAYFWEPIHVETQKLDVVQLTQALPWLKAEPTESVLLREVELRGVQSGVCYASAFSIVRLAVFEPALVEALCQGKIGLGVLIRDSGLESYRELLELVAHQGDAPTQAAENIDGMQMQRSYRIIANGVPAILITETFPCSVYRSRQTI